MNVALDGTAPDDEDVRQRRRIEGLPGDAEVLPPRESVSIFATGGFRDGPDGPEPSVSLSLSTGTVNLQASLGVEEVAELQAMLEEALADARETTEAVREADGLPPRSVE